MSDIVETIIKLIPYKNHIKVFFLNIYRRLILCDFIIGRYEYFYYISVKDLLYINTLKSFFTSKKSLLVKNIDYEKQNKYILENWVFQKNIEYLYFLKFQKSNSVEENLMFRNYSEKILNILLKYYCIKKIYFGKYNTTSTLSINIYNDVKKIIPITTYKDSDYCIQDIQKNAMELYNSIYDIIYFKNSKKNKVDYSLMISYSKLELQIKNHHKLLSKYSSQIR